MTSHLTVLDPVLEKHIAVTPPGMAHWAGTGPDGTSCRQCLFFASNGYYSANSKHGDTLKPSPCKQYQKMMNRIGPPIRYETASCKYFEPNPTPPSIKQPESKF